ncbi:hypothetical protein Tco_0708070 [Tanacetum coccineum]
MWCYRLLKKAISLARSTPVIMCYRPKSPWNWKLDPSVTINGVGACFPILKGIVGRLLLSLDSRKLGDLLREKGKPKLGPTWCIEGVEVVEYCLTNLLDGAMMWQSEWEISSIPNLELESSIVLLLIEYLLNRISYEINNKERCQYEKAFVSFDVFRKARGVERLQELQGEGWFECGAKEEAICRCGELKTNVNEPTLALPKGADDFIVYYDARSKDLETCLEKGREGDCCMSPPIHRKYKNSIAIATGCKRFKNTKRGNRKIRIPIALWPCKVEEEMTLEEVDGQMVGKVETKIIAEDGTITKVPGKFKSYETSDEETEEQPRRRDLYRFVDHPQIQQANPMNEFAPRQIPQPLGNMNGWLIESEEEAERDEVDSDLESTASSKPVWEKTNKDDRDYASYHCPWCSNYLFQGGLASIPEFCDTLIQHMESVKKSIDERALHKREYDIWVNERQMQTTEDKVDSSKALDASLVDTESSGTTLKEQDTSSRSGNDAHADDADIRPIYDEEPMAEVQTTAEINVFATGQQHTEQPEFNNEGEVDQNVEQCHDTCPLPANVNDNQTTELTNQSLESENIRLKKTVAQFQKDFLRMEAHCVNLELKYQNQALKEGQHVAKLLKENETLKRHYKEMFDSIKTTRAKNIEHTTSLIAKNDDFKAQLQEKGFAIAALKNELRKLTGNSVNTKFAKSSILGKPALQPRRNQLVVRQPTAFKSERPRFSKQWFASQVDVNNDLSKPVTTHYLPKERESAVAKPHHMIAPGSSRYSSNDMVDRYQLYTYRI